MVAREGLLPATAAFLLAAFVTSVSVGWSLPLWGAFGLIVYVFWTPRRPVPSLPLAIISPVDGTVDSIGEVDDPWLGRRAVRVSIRMPIPGIAALRSPAEGKVVDYWTRAGDGEADHAPHRSPTCYVLHVRTDEQDDIVFAVRSKWHLSRFKLDVCPGERIGQGQRNGFVYFASEVEVLMPTNARGAARPGESVHAGSDPIATLVPVPA